MDRERWQRASALIDEAWALDPPARAAWLADLARHEPELAQTVAEALSQDTEPQADQPGWTGFSGSLASAIGAATVPSAPDLAGCRLGAWTLEQKIGEGGMGQVWRASRSDGLYTGLAAIKLLRSELGSPAQAARFARERELLARLNHPAVARLLDAGIDESGIGPLAGQAYLVLELVQGRNLNAHVRSHAATLAQRVRLLVRVAEAVDAAHAQLVVHRDLKPSNVMVSDDGAPKLLDFGIAGLAAEDAGTTAGELTRQTGRGLTLGYAAPEQITGAPVGTAADVFSLGVMLYELIAGVLPFGPRQQPRRALEDAVLQAEPPRLSAANPATAATDADGPGRPVDAERAQGDLEAIAGKALRKAPGERYRSVGAFIDDLQAWLDHRPVSARRDNWRHNLRLWVRRHAVLATAGSLVLLSLGGGLAASLWQARRAEAAAHASDQVTRYLSDLMASARPENHGGQWPTVMQLLDKSRAELATRLADTPDTRLRVMQVMVETYARLNRNDVALPLGQDLVQQATAQYGPADARTLTAAFWLAQTLQMEGRFDRAIALLEPALPHVRQLPKPQHQTLLRQVLATLDACYSRLGRFEQAEQLLDEQRRHMAGLPADDPAWMSYYMHLTTLRNGQGRVHDALAAVRSTQPFWTRTEPALQREILTLQRNTLAMELRAAEYHQFEARSHALLLRMDGLLGPGNALAASLRHELARYHLEVGQYAAGLRQREANESADAALGSTDPARRLPLRAQTLMARAAARALPPEELSIQAQALFDASLPAAAALGSQRAEVWLAAARVALAAADAALATRVLDRMAADEGLNLAPGPQQDGPLRLRKLQLDGGLARLRGDLVASNALLAERLAGFNRGDLARLVPAWSAAIDLAYTRVLQRAPDAAAALADAASRRPASVPAGHPLDLALAYLRALHAEGDNGAGARQALSALVQAQQRGAPWPLRPPGPLAGNLGGVIF